MAREPIGGGDVEEGDELLRRFYRQLVTFGELADDYQANPMVNRVVKTTRGLTATIYAYFVKRRRG